MILVRIDFSDRAPLAETWPFTESGLAAANRFSRTMLQLFPSTIQNLSVDFLAPAPTGEPKCTPTK